MNHAGKMLSYPTIVRVFSIGLLFSSICIILTFRLSPLFPRPNDSSVLIGAMPPLMPWESIGGCGSSSGSVSSDMQLKWIGRGVSGALFDIEAIIGHSQIADTATGDAQYNSGLIRLSTSSLLVSVFFHPRILDIKLGVPFLMKQGVWEKNAYTTGTLSDISLDLSKKWGLDGALATAFVFSAPTGRSTIRKIGDLSHMLYAHPYLQMGSGVFGGTARVNYSIDWDWGLLSGGASYSGGLFALITKDYSFNEKEEIPVPLGKRLKISREGLGAINDIGTVTPDNISFFTDFGKKMQTVAHGISFSLSLPLRDGRWQTGASTMTDWSCSNPSVAPYFATKAEAQAYADTVKDPFNPLKNLYQHPIVVGTWSEGQKWALVDYNWIKAKAFPGFSLQYSVEKSDETFPLLWGCIVRYEFDRGIQFAGFSTGLGLKFPVY